MDDKLRKVLAEVLRLPPATITDNMAAAQCEAWTSLQHFNLILAVEEAFGVRFSSERIPGLTSVAALAEEIQKLKRQQP